MSEQTTGTKGFVLVQSQLEDNMIYVRDGDGSHSSQDVAVLIFRKSLDTPEGEELLKRFQSIFDKPTKAEEKPKQKWGICYQGTPYGEDVWLTVPYENPYSAKYIFDTKEEAQAFINNKRDSNEYLPVGATPAPITW